MIIRIGFTGTHFASMHAAAAQKIPDVELSAVVNHRSESMSRFAEEFSIPYQYATVEDLLREKKVDALVVSTPNALHAPQSIAALQAGVHVLVEKPLAMNSAEAEKMLATSEKSGALLMAAYCYRFHPAVRWLRTQVEAGRVGKILRTKGYSVHVNWGPQGWFTQKELAGGGALIDMGIHILYITRYLLGDLQPKRVYAKIDTFYRDFNVDDTCSLMIEWENGIFTYIETGWWQPHSDGQEISAQLYGTAGFGEVFPTRLTIPGSGWRDEVEKLPEVEGLDGFPREMMMEKQMKYFIDCIREGKKPVPGGFEGWTDMRIIDSAYTSAQTGNVISL